ncbi:MAG: NAD(+) synthase [Verrucomicrobiales bacterium]
MRLVHVAAAVLNQTPLDWRHNRENARAAVAQARAMGASLLCLPELCLTGYGCEDAFLSANTHRQAWASLRELLADTCGMLVCFGLPVLHQNGVFNCAAVAVDGRLIGLTAKRFLAGDGIHYEPRWFKAWPIGLRDELTAPDTGEILPLGDLMFEVGGVRVGFEICEDAWVAARPGAQLARHGVDIILNPSASHFAFGKIEIRKRFVIEGSRAFGASYVYANLLGNEAGRAIYDGEALIASGGRLLAEGPRFGFRDCLVTGAMIDVDATRMSQARTASFKPDLAGDNPLLIRAPFEWPHCQPQSAGVSSPRPAAWESNSRIKEEEFTRAVALGLFDYLRKSRSCGFVVSLSGGADSAAVSCLVHLMARLALADLGPEGVREKLAGILPDRIASNADVRDDTAESRALTGALLTTAYQATENSGLITRNAARAVAGAIGAHHFEFDVSELHRGYVRMIEGAIERKLEWESDDIALQNIQARVRSPGIWMLANLNGALLLSTSNRSEAAVGYATMDGDTSGGLAPIAGIDKAWLRHWLVWLETEGPLLGGQRVNLPALKAVNEQQPTAELRPAAQTQTDEADLMPYPLLDAIERAAIRDKQGPLECFHLMRTSFPELESRQLGQWVERFFILWSRNQWKRERYAPSFHLDDENLDPKTWCRWPILSGGFEEEIAEMWDALK